VLPNTEFDVGI